jgi:hypothetical protein
MAGNVTFTPTEEDVVVGARDSFHRVLRQPRLKGAIYIAVLAGGLLGAAFALQSGGPSAHALRGAGVGALAGLLLIAVILATRYIMLPGRVLRSFRQNRTAHTAYSCAWTDEGISWQSGASSVRILWLDLYRWGEGRSAFLFAVTERGMHLVPRRALSEAEAADLRATALRHGPARL